MNEEDRNKYNKNDKKNKYKSRCKIIYYVFF